jgi:hypothetical protein
MDTTPSLALPLLAAAQAQKHVTHNAALMQLDALVQLACLDRDLASPPPSPAEGDRYIVAAAPTGAWAGWADRIARYEDGSWTALDPGPGTLAWVVDEGALHVWTGAAWTNLSLALAVAQNLTRLGVGTAADATNPFAAKLNKALWTARTLAEGGDGDLRYTLNKEAAADTLSLLFQSGFEARAELGLLGDDDLRLKVSADGASFREALAVDRATGDLRLPGTWDGGHLVLGASHLWIDAAGRLRVKAGAPTSATDGTVVGAQT